MIIGSLKEHTAEETRVSLTPSVVKRLVNEGFTILLEKDYGTNAGFSDKEYSNSGAKIALSPANILRDSQIILQISPPSPTMLKKLTSSHILIADFSSLPAPNAFQQAVYIRLEKVPRTSAAQNIDIISAQKTVRGYAAALHSLAKSSKMAPQLTTAAASIKPASALIFGAGVTGLQAASVFKKQGCRITIADINPEARELAQSVGAAFVLFSTPPDILPVLKMADFILASAQTSSGAAPVLLNKKDLSAVPSGCIIVDTTPNNINIPTNRYSNSGYHFYRLLFAERAIPTTASELWAGNMYNLLHRIINPDKQINLPGDLPAAMLCPPLKTNNVQNKPVAQNRQFQKKE